MNDLGRREVTALRRARAVFQDLCNNLVDSRGFTHRKVNAGDSKEHYTQPNLESIPTEVNGNDFGPPTLLSHIESNASASSRKPMPTASDPSATPRTVHLGYGRSVGASDTASLAPASAQHTHENPAPDPSRRDARNSQLRPRERALRSSLAAMGVGCPYIHQTWHESPAIARPSAFRPRQNSQRGNGRFR